MRNLPIVLFILSILLLSCHAKHDFDFTQDFEEGWLYADSIKIKYHNIDTITPRKLHIYFGLNNDYPFQNLYIKYRVTSPSKKISESLSQYILQDSAGKWYAESSMDGSKHFNKVIADKVVLNELGNYVIDLVQFMRQDTLLGVTFVRFGMDEYKETL